MTSRAGLYIGGLLLPLSLAAGQGGLSLRDHSIDAGADWLSGGDYRLIGVIAQIDAEPLHPASGAALALHGGFLASAPAQAPVADPIFTDGFE